MSTDNKRDYPMEMVATKDGPAKAWVAWKGKVFAVTQEIAEVGGDGEPWDDNWRITHRPSGHAMGGRRLMLEDALKWAQTVDAVPEFATASYHDMVDRQQELTAAANTALRAAGLLGGDA